MIVPFLLGLLLQDVQAKAFLSIIPIEKTPVVVEWQRLPDASLKIPKPPTKKIIDGKESLGLQVTAKSAIVVDAASGKVLFNKDLDTKTPIASITKLMTALVFLDYNPGWNTVVTLEERDERVGATPRIYRGETVTVKDLFYSSLVSSDNNSTIALVRTSGLSESEFVQKMNEKALSLDLDNTDFVDATGLDSGNKSTALDISRLVYYALRSEEISHATTRPAYQFTVANNNKRRTVYTTDRLLESYIHEKYNIRGGKTGFTNEAGSCLGVSVEGEQGQEIIVVVLGSQDNQYRFHEVKGLTQWAFDNYNWSDR